MPRLVRSLLLAALAMGARIASAAAAPLAIHIHSDKAMFQVLISPGMVGTDSFVLQLMSGEGTLLPETYRFTYGTTREQMAAVAVKNHANGAKNPQAHMRKVITMEQALNGKPIPKETRITVSFIAPQ